MARVEVVVVVVVVVAVVAVVAVVGAVSKQRRLSFARPFSISAIRNLMKRNKSKYQRVEIHFQNKR